MLAVTLLALAAPLLPLADPDAVDLRRSSQPPLSTHLLGTDDLGRDMVSRLIWGARPSLAAGVLATLGALIPGALIGLLAGYRGGWFDMVAMRGVDMLLAFPSFLLAIMIVAALGPGLLNAMIAISIVGIPAYARVIRGEILAARGLEYVSAARVVGASDIRVIARHIVPNILPPVIVLSTLDVGAKIIVTASLSFLGLGVQPPEADWGSMLARGRSLMELAPHVIVFPGLAIAAVVLCLNAVGDSLRDVLDPRLR